MKIIIGADHRGCKLKEKLKEELGRQRIEVEDVGTHDEESCDYPDFGARVAKKVQGNLEENRGILVCATGIGMSMVANRISGIRAALCHNTHVAEMTRRHNDANVLCVGADVVDEDTALSILKVWLETEYEGGRHDRRVEKIDSLTASL